jgi:DNA-directed RNA polymerase specialized sigma24 family protein
VSDEDERKKLLAGQDWKRARARLIAVAFNRTKNRAWAEDLAQEAILRAHDVKRNPWDPVRHPKIEDFLAGIVLRLISNEWTSARAHSELQLYSMEREADTAPSPEEVTARRDLYDQRRALVKVRLAKNEKGLKVLDMMEHGFDTAQEQQEETGWDMKDIRNGRKSLFNCAERVAREMPADGFDDEEAGAPEEDEEVMQ